MSPIDFSFVTRATRVTALLCVTAGTLLSQGTPPKADSTAKQMVEFAVSEMATLATGSAAPRYPSALKDAGTVGVVVAQMVVDTNGTAIETTLKIVRATDPAFVAAVKEAMPGLRFSAARVDNRRVKQLVQIQYRFLLQGKESPADTLTTNSPIRQFDVTITGITK
ncbi:MAG: energy transducer TonB [Gemmatimonadetes bacterium]|nr:energy transducer TonB [Gemmatimonadota bacterium]